MGVWNVSVAGDMDVPCKEWVELWALALGEIPEILFFLSLLGWRKSLRSVSLEGDLENSVLRSLVGVADDPPVIVVVTPCPGVWRVSFSADPGALL